MKYHLSASIDGLIALGKPKLSRMLSSIKDENGNNPTVEEFMDYLTREKALGHKLIASERCDNFDPVLGCMGHDT